MRAPMRAVAACLALLGGAALAAPPAAPPAAAPAAQGARIVVAFANEPHTAPGPAGTTGSHYGGGGYRVGQSAQQQARRVARAFSLREVASWPIKALSMHCVVYEITNGRPVPDVLAALSKDQRVVLAQPLHEFHTLTGPAAPAGAVPHASPYNDPLYDLQKNLLTLGIARAHERSQGAGVRVALIDTGVDARHPDLAGRILSAQSFVGTLGAPRAQASSAALLRHGTAMAGVIAAVANNHIGIVGIAPQAQIEVFEACWQLEPDSDAAACNTFTLARALAAALASGAPLVNLSLAGPADPLLTALVERGLARGMTFVGASGGPDEGFPTAIHGVLAAAASEQPLPAGALGAPGQHVLTLRPDGQYDFESGASVAAAELTGVIALLMSASSTRLSTSAVASLLGGAPAAPTPNADPQVVDVTGALERLDSGHMAAAGRPHAAR
ncbi:MAG TPA: S8 family serine peptidase [Steroidobacteraceae bacterium]|nr:S8 family serine peptidase [Steroidobacteraceae bacterium]